jgi:histidinol-phosphate aminotransferase
VEELMKNVDSNTRIIFLCSPNNPSGNLLSASSIEKVILSFDGIVVVDEAYIDFSTQPSWLARLNEFSNLVVLQTFSKAWGLANLRIGMAFGSSFIIEMLNKVKPPYNIGGLTQKIVWDALQNPVRTKEMAARLIKERMRLQAELEKIGSVEIVYPSDANFLLVKIADARKKYEQLLTQGIVVRDRSNVRLCEGCLRITVGTPVENDQVLEALNQL